MRCRRGETKGSPANQRSSCPMVLTPTPSSGRPSALAATPAAPECRPRVRRRPRRRLPIHEHRPRAAPDRRRRGPGRGRCLKRARAGFCRYRRQAQAHVEVIVGDLRSAQRRSGRSSTYGALTRSSSRRFPCGCRAGCAWICPPRSVASAAWSTITATEHSRDARLVIGLTRRIRTRRCRHQGSGVAPRTDGDEVARRVYGGRIRLFRDGVVLAPADVPDFDVVGEAAMAAPRWRNWS